jgi:hypothetical protein
MLVRELSPKSNENIDFVMSQYPLLLQYSYSNTYFMKLIYSLFSKAQETKTKTSIKHTSGEKLDPESGPFLPQEIKTHIQSSVYELYTIHFYIKESCFEIKLYSTIPENINRFIFFIRFILTLCSKDVNLEKHYKLTFILSPFEKEGDSRIECLEPLHVNSGYNYKNEIVIFRKEELVKVFIHECFHLFCLDFKEVSIDFQKLLQPLFYVKSDYLLFESLCEFWARTLNAALFAFFMEKQISYEVFERNFQLNLNIERAYGLIQLKHFLSKFELCYEDLIEGKGTIKSYKENTNGICYYVITAILFFNYQQTMNWFIENNETLLQFTKTSKQIILFYHYIKSVYKNDKLLNTLLYIKNYELNHLSMCAFDIELFRHSSQSGTKENAED